MIIEDSRHYTKLRRSFLKAGKYFGFDILDQNGATQTGFSPYLYTINEGMRWTTADGYLKRKHNLHVALNAHVHKILFDGDRAIGVAVKHKGHLRKIYANKEVILSAGVVASPQILMLSGVGPAHHLKYHGVSRNCY